MEFDTIGRIATRLFQEDEEGKALFKWLYVTFKERPFINPIVTKGGKLNPLEFNPQHLAFRSGQADIVNRILMAMENYRRQINTNTYIPEKTVISDPTYVPPVAYSHPVEPATPPDSIESMYSSDKDNLEAHPPVQPNVYVAPDPNQ